MHLKNNSDFGILVISSDKYQDLWDPFFYCFNKNWVDCPFDIYLGSNLIKPIDNSLYKVILSGEDKDWSTSTKKIVSQIQKKFIIVILEDYFIISKVNTNEIIDHFNYMQLNSINHMHFENLGLSSDYPINDKYNGIESGAPYRVNVFGFWKTDTFLDLLLCGETPWEFEVMGSYRSKFLSDFVCIKKAPFEIINMVEKGKFFKESYAFCQKNNIDLSQSHRLIHGNKDNIISMLKKLVFNSFKNVSWKKRLSFMNFLRKILITY